MKKGITTRLVDRYIQELFTKGKTFVYEARNTDQEHEKTIKCFEMFKKRMLSEHSLVEWEKSYTLVDGIWCYKVHLL